MGGAGAVLHRGITSDQLPFISHIRALSPISTKPLWHVYSATEPKVVRLNVTAPFSTSRGSGSPQSIAMVERTQILKLSCTYRLLSK